MTNEIKDVKLGDAVYFFRNSSPSNFSRFMVNSQSSIKDTFDAYMREEVGHGVVTSISRCEYTKRVRICVGTSEDREEVFQTKKELLDKIYYLNNQSIYILEEGNKLISLKLKDL